MARLSVFGYDSLSPALQQLADAHPERGASWDHH